MDPETILKIEKTGIDTGVYVIVDQLSKSNIFDFNLWDLITFVSGDAIQRFIVNSEHFEFLKFLHDFPYDSLLERALLIELFRIIYVALSTQPKLAPLAIIIDFLKLNFTMGISDSLYPIVDSKVVKRKKKHHKDICDRHKWLYALIGPCVGIKGSEWLWKKKLPNLAGELLGENNKILLSIVYKLATNSPVILISGLLWLLLSEEGRALVTKGAQPSGNSISSGLSFAPLLLL